jgi:hypothetical protein
MKRGMGKNQSLPKLKQAPVTAEADGQKTNTAFQNQLLPRRINRNKPFQKINQI